MPADNTVWKSVNPAEKHPAEIQGVHTAEAFIPDLPRCPYQNGIKNQKTCQVFPRDKMPTEIIISEYHGDAQRE
jgi:hypothetical protein